MTATWSLTGRYLRDQVDSYGEYLAGPDAVAGASLPRSATSRWWRRAEREGGCCTSCPTSCRCIGRRRDDRMLTRDDAGVLIPEMFPENAAGLIPDRRRGWSVPLGGSQPAPREYLNHTFSSALTLERGTHMLKAGGLAAFEHVNSNLYPETTQGAVRFRRAAARPHFRIFFTATRPAHAVSPARMPKQTSTSSTSSDLAGTNSLPRIRGESSATSRSISGSATRSTRP